MSYLTKKWVDWSKLEELNMEELILWWGGATGLFFVICCIHWRYSGEGSSGLSRNSHGRTIGEPNTASDKEIDESSLVTLWRSSRTRWRWWKQLDPASWAWRETLSWWWNLSTIPSEWGWKEVVGEWVYKVQTIQRLWTGLRDQR